MRHSQVKAFFKQNQEKEGNRLVSYFFKTLWKVAQSANGLLLLFATMTGYVPWHAYRLFIYRNILRIKIGKQTSIHWRTRFFQPMGIKIGNNCVIQSDVFLDGREGLSIGNDVVIGPEVMIFTLEHDVNSPTFEAKGGPVKIDDYVWISTRAMVLPNITIGKGAVVAAGAVVTKDIEPYTIVGGIPARKIGERTKDLQYHLDYHIPFQ